MWLNILLACLAGISVLLLLWQWLAATRFPLHARVSAPRYFPAVTLLKPLKGRDEATEECLRTWFRQNYPAPVQILFGVADAADPVCGVVRRLQAEFPTADCGLLECDASRGANAKVSKLTQMARHAKHEVWVISDADVRIAPDLLVQAVQPLQDPRIGLVNCFYRLARATTTAMRWEAVAVNADFWSQVLQAKSLKPLDFALGAVMATRKADVLGIGGFAALQDCLADDYQLGNRIAAQSKQIAFCPVVVECLSAPMGWAAAWNHQLRWARTVRVCQPVPYFFSILSNSTFWPLLWLVVAPRWEAAALCVAALALRIGITKDLLRRLEARPARFSDALLGPLKDMLQVGLWCGAFLGNRIEWRGKVMQLNPDGTLSSEGAG